MPRPKRDEVFDQDNIGIYHLINRCVRRAFLCGEDSVSGRSFEHRRGWIRDRLEELAGILAIDILTFAVMSNHIHVLIRNRPDIRDDWSNEEVVRRWRRLFPKMKNGQVVELTDDEFQELLANKKWVRERRRRLAHVSWLMRCLTEKIARRANSEDEVTGRFWQGRFSCQRILDEAALLACSAYIDLNPIRAGMAKTPETSWFTSACERILARKGPEAVSQAAVEIPAAAAKASDKWLSPIPLEPTEEPSKTSRRASDRGFLAMSLDQYLELLDWTGRQVHSEKRGRIPAHLAPILDRLEILEDKWVDAVKNFGQLFRTAAGQAAAIVEEAKRRGRAFIPGQRSAEAAFR